MPDDEGSGSVLVESILAHERVAAERDRLEIHSDPQWRRVLADPEYKKLNRQFKAQMAKLPVDMPESTKINTPAVLKLIRDIYLMEQRFGADRRPLWERADTPERFRDGIARFAEPFLCTTVGEIQWAVIHDMFKKAVELSIKFNLPAPPEPPAENVTVEHRRNWLLKLRDWSHGKDAAKSGIALPATTLSIPTATAPAQKPAASDTPHAEFPPLTFVDSDGSDYRFNSPLLWELWRALYASKYPISFSQLEDGRIKTWHESASGDDAKVEAIKSLRTFWRKQKREDLAERIRTKSKTVIFEKS